MTDPIEAACAAYYANEVLLAKWQGHPLRTLEWRELDDDYKHEYRESMRAAIAAYKGASGEARDAARYRHFRITFGLAVWSENGQIAWHEDEIDAAIDADIAAREGDIPEPPKEQG